jgi:hypothetical protein
LLLKTGLTPIATIMRRLLTGHAVYFNRRHRRYGHLFQNRYKSILCQEEPYLRELVMGKTELAKRLNLTQPAVSIAVRRGEKIAREEQYQLIDDYLFIYLWMSLYWGLNCFSKSGNLKDVPYYY